MAVALQPLSFVMSERKQLTLVCLATMMLPYQVGYRVFILLLAAMGSTAYLSLGNIWRG
jgi:hypothetical protein